MNNLLVYIKKWSLLSLLLLLFALFFYLDLSHYLTLATIKNDQAIAQQWTYEHYKSAVSLYLAIYIILIACGIPCATLLTLLGGFLFGSIALLYATFSTTMGGVVLFLAVRTAIGSRIAAQSTGWIKKMEHGFQKNAFHYLLMLRLMPIFPCWISNIAAGALNVPLRIFISATLIGIFPATFIYVMAGRGLDKIFSQNQPPSLQAILTPAIFFPLLGLGLLSLLPVIYKKLKKNN